MLNDALSIVEPLKNASPTSWCLDLPPTDVVVHADPTRLSQVIVNLLTNAIKYSSNGGKISLTYSLDENFTLIKVADEGMGIDTDLLPHVFDLFRQESKTLDRSAGGLGIGLTIVKTIVEMHGGRVWAKSPGKRQGSEFIIALPIVSPDRIQTRETNDKPFSAKDSPCRILVVDDSIDARSTLARVLKMWGHTAVEAGDAVTCFAAFVDSQPDIVLLDIGLPGMDGYEIAKRLRNDFAMGKSILIALTGYGAEADRKNAKDAGFDYHFTKPVDLAELQSLINKLATK